MQWDCPCATTVGVNGPMSTYVMRKSMISLCVWYLDTLWGLLFVSVACFVLFCFSLVLCVVFCFCFFFCCFLLSDVVLCFFFFGWFFLFFFFFFVFCVPFVVRYIFS